MGLPLLHKKNLGGGPLSKALILAISTELWQRNKLANLTIFVGMTYAN